MLWIKKKVIFFELFFFVHINHMIGARRRKSSVDKSQDEEEDVGGNKQPVEDTSVISTTVETNEEIKPIEKPSVSLRKPLAFSQNGSTNDEQVSKKKRGRKPKTETNNNSIV